MACLWSCTGICAYVTCAAVRCGGVRRPALACAGGGGRGIGVVSVVVGVGGVGSIIGRRQRHRSSSASSSLSSSSRCRRTLRSGRTERGERPAGRQPRRNGSIWDVGRCAPPCATHRAPPIAAMRLYVRSETGVAVLVCFRRRCGGHEVDTWRCGGRRPRQAQRLRLARRP